eukprot:CAMPEP_0115001824 /NCGR_PEP_ID=MMETSP0216-20121206/17633_1 /TAXON_ID=223996 /ORGANISM="Protocruzia adherens, Strain Boccale" /LENGTH=1370 /DNA_ID=CAMNT_0002367287 /DNA_START=20 /DNA_END=4132 /DNA_ORIENTATION=+
MSAERSQLSEPLLNSSTQNTNDAETKLGESPPDFWSKINVFSKISFWWTMPLLRLGKKRPLKDEDMWPVRPEDDTELQVDTLKAHWLQEEQKDGNGNYPVIWAIYKSYYSKLLWMGFFDGIAAALPFVSPLAIQGIGFYLQDDSSPTYVGLAWVIALFLAQVIRTFFGAQSYFLIEIVGQNVSNGLKGMIYEKILAISPNSEYIYQQGKVVNLIQVDVFKLKYFIDMIPSALILIIQATLGIWLLFGFLGLSFLAGIGVILIVTFLNYRIGMISSKIQKQLMTKRDVRVRRTTELFTSVKIIKLFSWEQKFVDKVLEAREAELKERKRFIKWSLLGSFLLNVTPTAISTLTFVFYAGVAKKELDAPTIFAAMTIFNIIQGPIRGLPNLINSFIQNRVSLIRVQDFLRAKEIDMTRILREPAPFTDDELAVQIQNGWFSWGKDSNAHEVKQVSVKETGTSKTTAAEGGYIELQDTKEDLENTSNDGLGPVLSDINLEIPSGQFVAIVGDVGSGKSSLLSAMIGDIEEYDSAEVQTKPSVRILKNLAYSSQEPWLQNMTVKENVLYGKELNQDLYDHVLEVSCLKPDLIVFPDGDQTQIGDRGISLSGGQKARVALARTLYSQSDLFIMDDVLSAVDGHTGAKIFTEAFLGFLQDKTRVLVTHGSQYLPYVDRVIVLQNGKITQDGPVSLLVQEEGYVRELMKLHGSLHEDGGLKLQRLTSETTAHDDQQIVAEEEKTASSESSGSDIELSGNSSDRSQEKAKSKESKKKQERNIIMEEDRETGGVKTSIYSTYLSYTGGYITVVIIILAYVVFQGTKVFSDFWLGDWADESEEDQQDHVSYYLTIYCLIAVGNSVAILLKEICLNLSILKASQKLHYDMVTSLIKAPMNTFFDRTPTGRIINRFTGDLVTIDSMMGWAFNSIFNRSFQVLSVFFVIGIAFPTGLLMFPFMAYLAWTLNTLLLRTNVEVTRLNQINRSPIVNFFSETMRGISVIRSSDHQELFRKKTNEYLNKTTETNFALTGTSKWFSTTMSYISISVLTITSAYFVVSRDASATIAALVLSYTVTLNDAIFWVLRSFTFLEGRMVSVERTHAYTQVEHESNIIGEKEAITTTEWPSEGKIVFSNYSVRYRQETPLVLKNLTCTIQPGEKVGIVGRSGAGKTTITLSLFRILNAASGSITIDGLDISKVDLRKLRSNISLIPQEPLLFAGTLRFNLDPFNEFSEDQLMNGVAKVGLGALVASWPRKLDHEIKEGGENLSVGERQLICVVRALIRRKKVVLIDEATASVDSSNDQLIQESLRHFFVNSTVLTIAHRINTILESDKIMVLSSGKLVEFDTPTALRADANSRFSGFLKKHQHDDEATKTVKEED